MKNKCEEGIDLLYRCAVEARNVFVKQLEKKPQFIEELENLLGKKNGKENLVLEMLNIYYEAE